MISNKDRLENASTQLKVESIKLADMFENGDAVTMNNFINAVRNYENAAETFAQQDPNN